MVREHDEGSMKAGDVGQPPKNRHCSYIEELSLEIVGYSIKVSHLNVT